MIYNKKQYHHSMQYKKRSGVTTIEYGILAALIAIVIIATITILGTKTNNLFCTIESKMISSTGTGTRECYKKEIFGDLTPTYQSVYGQETCGDMCVGGATSIDSNIIEAINNQSPIISIKGLYNPDGSPATTIEEATNILNLPTDGESNSDRGTEGTTEPDGNQYEAEFKTADGNSYGIFYNGSTNEMEYRNLNTGETYAQNIYTGAITSQGTIYE